MKPKVLVIEDNEQNLYLMTFILEHHGYEVIPARDGAEGVAIAGKVDPVVVLLDIQLPEMDGYTVAKLLRENSSFVRTPIIAVTTYAMVGDREKAISAGCSGYIEKPINPDTFISEMEKHLRADIEDKE